MTHRTLALLLVLACFFPQSAPAAEKGSFAKPEKVKKQKAPRRDERPACSQQSKTAPLDSEGVYRCQGVPFVVALEPGVTYEQTFGRGWLSIQRGGKDSIAVVSYKPATWTLQPDREKGQRSYAGEFLKAIGAKDLKLGEPTPYEQPHAEDARSVTFDFGPPERHFAGESRSFFVRGWFVNMMLGGLESSPLKRGGPGAKALFASLKVVEKPLAVTHTFSSGEILALPPESWPAEGGRSYVPSTGAFLSLGTGASPKPCKTLSEADWAKITGDVAPADARGKVHFQSSRWIKLAKERFFLAQARTEIGEGKLVPGVAAVFCREGRLFQIFALDTLAKQPEFADEVVQILGTVRRE